MPPLQFLPSLSISRPKMPLLITYCAVSALTVSVFAGVLLAVPVHAFVGAPPVPASPGAGRAGAARGPGAAGPGAAAAPCGTGRATAPAGGARRAGRPGGAGRARGAGRPGDARGAVVPLPRISRHAGCACDGAGRPSGARRPRRRSPARPDEAPPVPVHRRRRRCTPRTTEAQSVASRADDDKRVMNPSCRERTEVVTSASCGRRAHDPRRASEIVGTGCGFLHKFGEVATNGIDGIHSRPVRLSEQRPRRHRRRATDDDLVCLRAVSQ